MQQSVLEQFENTHENELAPRGLCPVPGTELDENIIYFSPPPGVEVGHRVKFDIERCGRNNKQVSSRPVGKIVEFLPGGRVLIRGISEKGIYNRSLADVEAVTR